MKNKRNPKQVHRPGRSKSKDQPISTIPTTDVQAALQWLTKIDESPFRDQVLRDVFRGMKHKGLLLDFKNIHGTNENGIDYVLIEDHPIHGEIWTGIQAKSLEIRPSASTGTMAVIEVINQCERAALHKFQIDGKTSRLNLVEIWCSRTVTEKAEEEIRAAATRNKLGLKTAGKIIDLIRDYAPEWLSKIPECALAKLVHDGTNPIGDGFRLLKTKINVRDHFIEPLFSEQSAFSSDNVADNKLEPKKQSETIRLKDAIDKNAHLMIYGTNLSGKTYLLKRIRYLYSKQRQLCVYCDSDLVNSLDFPDIFTLVAELCPPLRKEDIEALSINSTVILCIDDFHLIESAKREMLLKVSPSRIKLAAALQRFNNIAGEGLCHLHIAGVDFLSVSEVVRTLEKLGNYERPLVDRAQAFIQRTFAYSGMPLTPFSVAMALEFLDSTPTKLNTPTFGRLINRFIENQLGSHDDTASLVDFESKRAFLRKLSGRTKDSYDIVEMRREVITFLAQKGHKHTSDDFLDDLVNSGVFKRTYSGKRIGWAHGVMRLNFWVSSVLDKGVYKPLEKKLLEYPDVTLAALVGSRLENAGELIKALMKALPEAVRQTKKNAIASLHEVLGEEIFPNDDTENDWLNKIENEIVSDKPNKPTSQPPNPESGSTTTIEVTKRQRREIQKKLEPYLTGLISGNFHVAFNLCGLILNARDTNASIKEDVVARLIEAFDDLGGITSTVFTAIMPEDGKFTFISTVVSRFFVHGLLDHFMGDPFLGEIFKRVLMRTNNPMRKILLLDLLLECGDDVSTELLATLKRIKRLDISWTIYLRVLFLYRSRFHRLKDKQQLKTLLENIRKIHKRALPALPAETGRRS